MSVTAGSPTSEENKAEQILNAQDVQFESDAVRSEEDILRDHVRENPRDADTWLKLVDIVEESKDYDKINETYEALLEAFPNTVSNLSRTSSILGIRF